MAYLERVGDKYRVVWRLGGRGSPRQKSPIYDTKKLALEALRQVSLQNAVTVPIRGGEIFTWEECVERYIASKRQMSVRYRNDVRSVSNRAAGTHSWKRPCDVRSEQIVSMPAYTARVVLAVLRFSASIGQATDARALKAKAPRVPGKPQDDAMPPELVNALIEKADRWALANGTIAYTISTYGHRAESLVELKVAAFDGSRLTLRVKNGKTVRHELTAESVRRLALIVHGRSPDDPLFVSHLGKPWATGSDFASWWSHSIAADAGRRAGILNLRQYGISRMFWLGLDAKTVADISGHKTVSLLQNTYARTTDARRQQAVRMIGGLSRDTTVPPDDVVSY